MKLNLIIPGIPKPKQSFRFTKTGLKYQPKEVKETERNIKYEITMQLPKGFQPLTGGIRINKLWYIFPPLKNFSAQKTKMMYNGIKIHKITKPDLTDNLQKSLFDAMQGLVFLNDSQVCVLNNVQKFYGVQPRIEIELEELNS